MRQTLWHWTLSGRAFRKIFGRLVGMILFAFDDQSSWFCWIDPWRFDQLRGDVSYGERGGWNHRTMQHATNDCFKVDEVNTVCFFSGWERVVLSCFMTGGMRSSRSLPQMLPCRRNKPWACWTQVASASWQSAMGAFWAQLRCQITQSFRYLYKMAVLYLMAVLGMGIPLQKLRIQRTSACM